MSEEQMRVLRMIEEGKISAEDGAKLLGALTATTQPAARVAGGGPTGPMPPIPPMPPMPPMAPMPPTPPMPARPPGISDREWEQVEREHERAMRDHERAMRDRERDHERAMREYERERERAERERDRAERDRERARRERGRGRGGVVFGGPADVFWGERRRGPRDTGPLPEEGPSPGGSRWFRVRVTDVRSGKVKVNVSLPLGLINFGLKLGAKYVPEEAGFNIDEIREAVRSGIVGKIISVEDSDDGERVEVFVE